MTARLSISPALDYNQKLLCCERLSQSSDTLLCVSTLQASMALKESEAIVLRTYPLREADLLVTLFTRLE